MTDWGLDPEAWEQYAKGTAAILDVLNRLRDALSRRKKGAKRDLEKELDALRDSVLQVVQVIAKQSASHREFVTAVVNMLGPMDAPEGKRNVDKWIELINRFTLTTQAVAALNKVVLNQERRLLALEQRPEGRSKRVPKKKPRRR
jgi:hypothetical protein